MISMKVKEIVIDLGGLVGVDDIFIPKEIAVLSVEGNYIGHWLIAPPHAFNELPFSARRQNCWLTSNFHRLEWEFGHTPFKAVSQILKDATKNVSRIYVRGREKVIFLQRILSRTIVNLETYTPAFKRLPENKRYCVFHADANLHGEFTCALHNAAKLKIWIRTNIYSDKVTLKEEHVNKIWNIDAYRISQITAHEVTSDEDAGIDTVDEDSDTISEGSYKVSTPPVVLRRKPPQPPKEGKDVCGHKLPDVCGVEPVKAQVRESLIL